MALWVGRVIKQALASDRVFQDSPEYEGADFVVYFVLGPTKQGMEGIIEFLAKVPGCIFFFPFCQA